MSARAAAPVVAPVVAPVAAPVPSWPGGPRVVHVPAAHDYVRHATVRPGAPVCSDAGGPDLPPFSWREGEAWLGRHGGRVDVLHVHFGFDQTDAEGLGRVLDAAAGADVAVVWTVHDLTNPHLVDQRPHEAQLAVLAARAAGLVTLTPGAAEEVRSRWGRSPVVVPHPHLAPLDVLGRPRPPAAGPPVVSVPLGLLRPATDPDVVRALLHPAVAEALPAGTVLRVGLREEVLADGFPRPDAALVDLLRAAHAGGRVQLVVGPRTPDAVLWRELATAAALVLPYRWGTHSGWVESCHDVGTPVVAPAAGRWGEQQRVHAYRPATCGAGPAAVAEGLGTALAAALAEGPRHRPVLDRRLAAREASVGVHERLHALAARGGRW